MFVVLSSVTAQYVTAYNGITTPIDYRLQRAERVQHDNIRFQIFEKIAGSIWFTGHCIEIINNTRGGIVRDGPLFFWRGGWTFRQRKQFFLVLLSLQTFFCACFLLQTFFLSI